MQNDECRIKTDTSARKARTRLRGSQVCSGNRGREPELEGGDRDACRVDGHGGEDPPAGELPDAAGTHLPREACINSASEPTRDSHDQPVGYLRDRGADNWRGLGRTIGAERRRNRHYRKNLSSRPKSHFNGTVRPSSRPDKGPSSRPSYYTSGVCGGFRQGFPCPPSKGDGFRPLPA
jgi:hypothetical protein